MEAVPNVVTPATKEVRRRRTESPAARDRNNAPEKEVRSFDHPLHIDNCGVKARCNAGEATLTVLSMKAMLEPENRCRQNPGLGCPAAAFTPSAAG